MIYHKFIYFEEMWHSINREIKQNEKDNLLILATFCRLPEFAEFLVRNGADPNYSDVHGYKAIRYAAEQKRPIINLFRCLLDAGSEVNGPILSQRFLLLSPDIVELLLQRGADPNECNSAALRMSIPIYFSVSLESVEKECLYKTIELLLKHKADPNITCDGEEPILQQAVTYRNFQIFQLLVEHGADFNGNHYNAVSVFHRTICYGFEHMIELLLQKGADPDAVNNEGRTPLQLAVINYCKIEIFKILLENPYRRADPNAVDSSGRTALHYTVSYGCNAEIISFLVEHGADPERVDQTGKKPRDYLREEHKTRKIMKLLGAKL